MTITELLGKILAPDSPWILVLAAVLLGAAAAVGRRLFASVRRIGARVGSLEQRVQLERTRRRQVEHELRELGVSLPYWPLDGNPPPVGRPSPAPRVLEDQDDDDQDEPYTREVPRPPVPGFTEDERSRIAQHRR